MSCLMFQILNGSVSRRMLLAILAFCIPALSQGASTPGSPLGKVFILSAPSGTGKTTLVRQLVRQVPDLVFAVSHTTRPLRPGEKEGVDYHFVDAATFDALLAKGAFVEWVATYGARYGLSREDLQKQLADGKDVLLDLNTEGARMLCRAVPDSIRIFLLPPSAQELARRLRDRGTETAAQVAQRMERAKSECSRFHEYEYLVVNTIPDQACRELQAIILATRALRERRQAVAQKILDGF